ncbi:MAG TPA: tetratricopeptide repeat protein, partial [bacterium]
MSSRLGILILCFGLSTSAWAVTAQEYYSTGNALYQQGKYLDAVKYYQAAIRKDPQNWQAYQGLGNANYKLGNTKKARTAYKRSLAIHPDNPDLRGFMAGKTPASSDLDEDSPILPLTVPKVASPPPSAPGAVSL